MPKSQPRPRIAKESLLIAFIGLADLITTILWVRHNGAQEANPLFRFYLSMGVFWFAVIKLVFLVGPIAMLECARRYRPTFTRWASRFAIAAYLGVYAVGVARLNPEILHPGHHRLAPGAAMADYRLPNDATIRGIALMHRSMPHRLRMRHHTPDDSCSPSDSVPASESDL